MQSMQLPEVLHFAFLLVRQQGWIVQLVQVEAAHPELPWKREVLHLNPPPFASSSSASSPTEGDQNTPPFERSLGHRLHWSVGLSDQA